LHDLTLRGRQIKADRLNLSQERLASIFLAHFKIITKNIGRALTNALHLGSDLALSCREFRTSDFTSSNIFLAAGLACVFDSIPYSKLA